MDYTAWEPIYHQILTDFGFKQADDESAAYILSGLLATKDIISIENISSLIKNKTIYVFGAGPSLEEDIKNLELSESDITIAADGATTEFINNNKVPDIIVTDLDGIVPDQILANERGAIVIIQGHGDNISVLKQWLPKFGGKLLGTTQTNPKNKKHIHNFGGFTDGDRAIFLAAHFMAKRINVVAFNFSEIGRASFQYQPEIKLRKLTWANLLIGMIKKPPIVFLP